MSIANRLGRAFGHLLLALINATLILVIVAALAVGFAVRSLEDLAERGMQGVTRSALTAARIDPQELNANLAAIRAELAQIRDAIAAGRADGQTGDALQRVEARLSGIGEEVRGLTDVEITIDPATLSGVEALLSALLAGAIDAAGSRQGDAQTLPAAGDGTSSQTAPDP